MKKEMRRIGLFQGVLMLMFLLLGIAFQAQAQAQNERKYISPRLQLGLHTKASLDSPVRELLSSGTAVEVIKTDKDFSQIKTAADTAGWVKSKFLTAEEPAQRKVEQLELALQQAEQELLEIKNTDSVQSEQGQQLSNSQKSAYEETIAGLEAELKAWEQLDSQDKQAQKKQAEKFNEELKQRLAMIAALANGNEQKKSSYNLPELNLFDDTDYDSKQAVLKQIKKHYLFLLIIAGLGFFLGIFAMDAYNRKRHGGFRV